MRVILTYFQSGYLNKEVASMSILETGAGDTGVSQILQKTGKGLSLAATSKIGTLERTLRTQRNLGKVLFAIASEDLF